MRRDSRSSAHEPVGVSSQRTYRKERGHISRYLVILACLVVMAVTGAALLPGIAGPTGGEVAIAEEGAGTAAEGTPVEFMSAEFTSDFTGNQLASDAPAGDASSVQTPELVSENTSPDPSEGLPAQPQNAAQIVDSQPPETTASEETAPGTIPAAGGTLVATDDNPDAGEPDTGGVTGNDAGANAPADIEIDQSDSDHHTSNDPAYMPDGSAEAFDPSSLAADSGDVADPAPEPAEHEIAQDPTASVESGSDGRSDSDAPDSRPDLDSSSQADSASADVPNQQNAAGSAAGDVTDHAPGVISDAWLDPMSNVSQTELAQLTEHAAILASDLTRGLPDEPSAETIVWAAVMRFADVDLAPGWESPSPLAYAQVEAAFAGAPTTPEAAATALRLTLESLGFQTIRVRGCPDRIVVAPSNDESQNAPASEDMRQYAATSEEAPSATGLVTAEWFLVRVGQGWYHLDLSAYLRQTAGMIPAQDIPLGETAASVAAARWLLVSDATICTTDASHASWTAVPGELEAAGLSAPPVCGTRMALTQPITSDALESDATIQTDSATDTEVPASASVADSGTGSASSDPETLDTDGEVGGRTSVADLSQSFDTSDHMDGLATSTHDSTLQMAAASSTADTAATSLTVDALDSADATLAAPKVDPTKYTYTVRPLLPPFNCIIYVQTDNPDPSSFYLIDKSTRYSASSNVQGSTDEFHYRGVGVFAGSPAMFFALPYDYIDVKYENASTRRVKGGYLFFNSFTCSDGGNLTLGIRNSDGTLTETKVTVSCAAMKDDVDYLIDTYTKGVSGFFNKLDAVQAALDEIAVYPHSIYDMSQPGERPYPLLATSPYPELTLSEHYDMYSLSSGMLLNSAYPFVLDSGEFPGTIAAVAQRLQPSCTVSEASYHYLVDITYGGTTRSYGGAGTGGDDPVFSDRVARNYTFTGAPGDLATNATLAGMRKLYLSYSAQASEDIMPYREMISGTAFNEAVGPGSWLQVASEGWGYRTTYTYVADGPDGGTTVASDAWVDGRYVNSNEALVLGETFADHPTADIIVRGVSYTDRQGKAHTNDIIYEYDPDTDTWRAPMYYTAMYSYDPSEELPSQFILSRTQVEAMHVDANSRHIPVYGLVYDGTQPPGTPFTNTLLEDVKVPPTMTTTIFSDTPIDVTFVPSSATDRQIRWTSSDDQIATINSDSVVRAYRLGTVTFTGLSGDGAIAVTCKVTVKPAPMSKATVEPIEDVYYQPGADGSVPRITEVSYGFRHLVEGTDYTVRFSNNRSAGTATATFTGKGNCTGTKTVYFKVKPLPITDASVSAPYQNESGKPLTPAITVNVGGTTLKAGTDYTVTYSNNVKVGTGNFTVTGKGNYTGTVSGTFRICPKDVDGPRGNFTVYPTRFVDCPSNAWYMTGGWIDYAVSGGFMTGYLDPDGWYRRFGPDDPITRAQAATIIYRYAWPNALDTIYAPFYGKTTHFSDVPKGQWYTAAVEWCYQHGIITGYGNSGRFGPNDPVTREQLATMMYRFARFYGISTSASAKAFNGCRETGKVSPWAHDAMVWCADRGIITGAARNGARYLDPQGTATRAQMAKIITVMARDVL